MGNRIAKVSTCFTGPIEAHHTAHNDNNNLCMANSYDEGLGHSFCYLKPDPTRLTGPPSSKIHSEEESTSVFRSISGASVSANTSTPLSTSPFFDTSAAPPFFESSAAFASVPLQPIPRSGPVSGPLYGSMSGPIDRSGGFMSGPLERSGPVFSGPLDRSFSVHGGRRRKRAGGSGSIIRDFRRAVSKTFRQSSVVAPLKGRDNWIIRQNSKKQINEHNLITEDNYNNNCNDESAIWEKSKNLEWAQGKAGEDRVHVVVSDERGWVFVGIYDGFNGPDATDFLSSNLYVNVQNELKGLLWDDNNNNNNNCLSNSTFIKSCCESEISTSSNNVNCSEVDISSSSSRSSCNNSKNSRKSMFNGANKKWEENHKRWKCEWDRERVELDRRLKEKLNNRDDSNSNGVREGNMVNHNEVLKAFSRALRKTEEAYLDIADKMLDENPELALMGSCVLAMLMKGEDVYVMNVGDSRAVLGIEKPIDLRLGKVDQDLERINEESLFDFDVSDGVRCNLNALQLTIDHSTSVDEEVQRIREDHPDDASAVMNDRVKGSLKVTRAFGAGFLKQKKWNDALLEMFQIDYIGNSPYINCLPFLYHHRLGPKDRFLILSSDGLYQYFTNEEAVSEVELFISMSPEGDPAQHLIEEVLFRAAKRAGLDFYELLEIPQGDRRKYHDDVSIIVISFEGRIWRSCL